MMEGLVVLQRLIMVQVGAVAQVRLVAQGLLLRAVTAVLELFLLFLVRLLLMPVAVEGRALTEERRGSAA
jgi:hypothetical protein